MNFLIETRKSLFNCTKRNEKAKQNGRRYQWNQILALQFQNGEVKSYCLDWEADKTPKQAYPIGWVKRSSMLEGFEELCSKLSCCETTTHSGDCSPGWNSLRIQFEKCYREFLTTTSTCNAIGRSSHLKWNSSLRIQFEKCYREFDHDIYL